MSTVPGEHARHLITLQASCLPCKEHRTNAMRPPVHASSLLAALIAAGILCICSRSHRCGLETLTPRALGKRAAQAVLGLGLLAPLDPQAMRCALADTASARVQEGRVFEEVWKNVNDNFFDDTYNKVTVNQTRLLLMLVASIHLLSHHTTYFILPISGPALRRPAERLAGVARGLLRPHPPGR